MKLLWNEEKNKLLKETRGVSFDDVVDEIAEGRFIGPETNPAREGQKRIIVLIDGYPHVVPFVVDENGNWFLKTIFPSRKLKERVEANGRNKD